jgi:pyruvate/2-oxoglutarate/acetoin dehydrogenase E1 component
MVVIAYGIFMSGNILAFFPIVMHFAPSGETMRGMALHSTLWGIRWVTMPGLVIVTVDTHLFDQRWLFLIGLGMVIFGLSIIGSVYRRQRVAVETGTTS